MAEHPCASASPRRHRRPAAHGAGAAGRSARTRRAATPGSSGRGRQLRLLMSTPLCRAGHVYALDRKDGLKCVEIQNGKVRWEGERALNFDERAELILARLTPEKYEELSRTRILGMDT